MFKYVFWAIFFSLVIAFPLPSVAVDEPSVAVDDKPLCSTTEVEYYLGKQHLKSLEIETKKTRKWATNYFKILLDPARNIHPDRKKKYTATLKAVFKNGVTCIFKAKIRIHGDWKDHVRNAPALITSLDVKLLNGNIDSVVSFKLFLPHTRNGDNELFATTLLDELGFIVPKTRYVRTVLNGVKYTYLFQEKVRKEMLEAHSLREGPVLEGDERFAWLNTADGVDDRFGLARIANENWTRKGDTSLNISENALSRLNTAYLEYTTAKHLPGSYEGGADKYGVYLEPGILANGNAYAEQKNNEYVALMIALQATHGLAPHNRKFYYDPMYRYLLPIYYDGDSHILDNSRSEISSKFLPSSIEGARYALTALRLVDETKLLAKQKDLGSSITQKKFNRAFETLKVALEDIIVTGGISRSVKYRAYFSGYDEPDKLLVFSGDGPREGLICNFAMSVCEHEQFNIDDYAKILNGRYIGPKGKHYLFVGISKDVYLNGGAALATQRSISATVPLADNAVLTTYGTMKSEVDHVNKVLYLFQEKSGDRALISGGSIIGWQVVLTGKKEKDYSEGQRFDEHLLTGCITFLDTILEDIVINADSASCEDAINLVRVSGNINTITIKDAMSDGLDVDFSSLGIENLDVTGAGNDCVDLSSGSYNIDNSRLSDCNDKAISVGEASRAAFTNIHIENANLGVAVKDSSSADIHFAQFVNVSSCLAVSKKKQEFWGGKIKISGYECPSKQNYQELGSLIEYSN